MPKSECGEAMAPGQGKQGYKQRKCIEVNIKLTILQE